MLNIISKILTQNSFWAIIGIIIGVLLSTGIKYIRDKLRIVRLKKMIGLELQSILYQIHQKKDITSQMINSLKENKILSGKSVKIINTGYKSHIAELYEHLSLNQRNCLHFIHERLDIADETLFSFEDSYINNPHKEMRDLLLASYKKKLPEIMECYKVVSDLINSYLNGTPKDVFNIKIKT